jgi:anti-sigma B factor antagonist
MARQIVVTCKKCGKKLKTDEHFLGRRGRCPGCGSAIKIEDSDEPAGEPVLEPMEESTTEKPTEVTEVPTPSEAGIERTKQSLLTVEKIGDVALVRFMTSRVLDQSNVNQLGQELDELIDKYYLVKMVLNFERIHYMSSAVMGKLVNLKRKIDKERGDLRLACIDPNIMEIFKIMRFNKIFNIYDTEEQAIKGLLR